jgi:hypothetical protein
MYLFSLLRMGLQVPRLVLLHKGLAHLFAEKTGPTQHPVQPLNIQIRPQQCQQMRLLMAHRLANI